MSSGSSPSKKRKLSSEVVDDDEDEADLPDNEEDLPDAEEIPHSDDDEAQEGEENVEGSSVIACEEGDEEEMLATNEYEPDLDDDAPAVRRPSPDPAVDVETGTYKLECPFCAGPYVFPVITCMQCKVYTICKQDLQNWAHAKGGTVAQMPCPQCKSKKGFEKNRPLNDIIGQRKVPCPNAEAGCPIEVAVVDCKQHMRKYCDYQPVECSQRRFGCPWKQPRQLLAAHTADCTYEAAAQLEARLDERRRAFAAECAALEQRVTLIKGRLETEETRCRQRMADEMKQVRALHETLSPDAARRFMMKTRTNDVDSMPLRDRQQGDSAAATVPFELEIKIGARQYYQIWGSFKKPQLRFPIFVAGYVLSYDPNLLGEQAISRFQCRFDKLNQAFLLFDEKAAFAGRAATEPGISREEQLNFRVVCSMLK